ncbi:hypothetical protein BDY24DRAFT_432754, partial [Mrakia frigida]|uniref:uncharacterized protein n=1 Tax=Mrakia frigida TaxID=29902 RepID=UPI003FCC0A0F
MSNESNLKEGKDRPDDKVVLVSQESQVGSHLPPPPPLDSPSSSSSSSSLPPISHHRPQPTVASSSASGDPVAAQIAQLFSLVGRVCSENEALKAQVAPLSAQDEAHSSSIARLSSENEELRKKDEEKQKTMKEMTKAFGGHWVWEAGRGEEKGRWLWSGEKYRRATPQVTESKRPPSLDSLPVELFNSVTSLLGRPEHLALCQVSFNLLGKSSSLIYRDAISLGSKRAASFVSSRNHTPLPPDNRICPLLLPSTLVLSHSRFNPSHLASLIPPRPTPPIPLDRLLISRSSSSTFVQWSPVLQLLNPSLLHFDGLRALDPNQLPTTFPVVHVLPSLLDSTSYRCERRRRIHPSSSRCFRLLPPYIPRASFQEEEGRDHPHLPVLGWEITFREVLGRTGSRLFFTSGYVRGTQEDAGLPARRMGGGVTSTDD